MRSSNTNRMFRALSSAGVVAGPLFVTVFSLDGATRSGYLSNRHPVSSLALGPRGQLQTANFAVTGTAYLASTVALARTTDPAMTKRSGPALIAAAAAGILAAAVFTTDPVSGYPPGTPDTPIKPTTTGTLHDLVAIPTFVGLPLAAMSYSWRFARTQKPGWAVYSASTAVVMLATLGISGAGFNQSPRFVDTAGRWQRVCIVAGFAWLTTLNARALRHR